MPPSISKIRAGGWRDQIAGGMTAGSGFARTHALTDLAADWLRRKRLAWRGLRLVLGLSAVLLGLVGRGLAVVQVPGGCPAGALFCDDFNDNSIDPSKWTSGGNVVTESGGEMHVDNTVTDRWGTLRSGEIDSAPNSDVTVTRKVKVHYANQYHRSALYFYLDGNASTWSFGINYDDYAYTSGGGTGECAISGFYIVKDIPAINCSPSDRSQMIPPKWDTWFDEKIVYHSGSGLVEYFIDGVKQAEFNVGHVGPQKISLYLNADGWFTGHYQYFDDIVVTQAAAPTCGNGTVDPGEVCDDGVAVNGTEDSCCAKDCTFKGSTPGDRDGDGILDDLESQDPPNPIFDLNGDGIVDASERPDPNHKDVYVEVDWMKLHRPNQSALDFVVRRFAEAPVCNPDHCCPVKMRTIPVGWSMRREPSSRRPPKTAMKWAFSRRGSG